MVRISLTPIIDVVFILLIFFMLATNFQKFNQMDINIATETVAPSILDKEVFIIKFDSSGNYKLNDTPYSLDDIKKKFESVIPDNPDYMVILKPANKTNLQSILNVVENLNKNKIQNISIGVLKDEVK